MGLLFYIFFTRLYFIIISLISPFNSKARLFINGRKHIFSRLKNELNNKPGKLVWFHCASLGEFEQGRPLMEAFKKTFPSNKIFLTFFSPSGFEIRKNYSQADFIYYMPLDTKSNAKTLLSLINPVLVIFVKYEYWYFHISEIKKRNIPLLSVSAIFRPDQIFFKRYGKFYSAILRNFHHFFVQNQQSQQLLQNIGLKNVTVAGDTRFDRVKEITENVQPVPLVEEYIKGSKILVAGSTWKEDLEVLAPLVHYFSGMKFIIAPREINDSSLREVEQLFPESFRFSKGANSNSRVMIIDNIGMLSSLYNYADYAFIGGAFGKGLHNILEAATFGMPIFFGNKNFKKFAEALNLIKSGVAFAIGSSEELKKIIKNFENHPDQREEVRKISKKFVEENTGATQLILECCKEIIFHNDRR